MSDTTYRITAPDNRTRVIVGVPFADGIGFTADPARLAFFERRGWDIEPVAGLIGEPLTAEQEAELADLTAQGLTVTVQNADGTVTPGTIPSSGEVVTVDAEAAAAQEAADEAAKQAAADAQKAADEAAKAAEAQKAAETAKAKPAAKSANAKK